MSINPKLFVLAYSIVLGAIFFLVAAGKPTAIYSAIGDEPLFLRLGMSIAQGQWLGAYTSDTLVKGAGYPLFLFANYMSGLPIGIGQLMLYFVAAIYLSHSLARIGRTYWIFAVLVLLLLILPVLYSHELQRLLRDLFYTAIGMLYFAAILDSLLLQSSPKVRWLKVAFAGVLAGILWITREEGIWIVPATLFVLLASTLRSNRAETYARLRSVGLKLAVAGLAMAAVLTAVASLNRLYYGSFTLNQIKSKSFQGALVALQRASASDRRPFLPVPKAARIKIYEQSPTFARLKPYLDPDRAPSPWNFGCQASKSLCGDIGGGWFMWAFRAGVAGLGIAKSPGAESRFYDRIAGEVGRACSEGRLQCSGWLPPLIPYMSLDQALALPAHVFKALSVIAMWPPMSFDALPSNMDPATREDVLAFLNHPVHIEGPPTVSVTLAGWYRGQGDAWISVTGSGSATPPTVSRTASPDLVTYFSQPALHHQRFVVRGTCIESDPCSFGFRNEQGKSLDLDPLKAAPTSYRLGDGELHFDVLQTRPTEPPTLRTKLYKNWVSIVSSAQRPFSWIIILGGVAFVAAVLQAIYRRRISAGLIAASTLVIAVLSRAGLLALIDVSSFAIILYTYCMPAIPLAMAAAVLSIFELARSTFLELRS